MNDADSDGIFDTGETFTFDVNNDGDTLDAGEDAVVESAINVVNSTAADASIRVRVNVVVEAGLPAGAEVDVRLGNTGANDNSTGTQNQVLVAAVDNVFTSDADSPVSVPVNSEREAAALLETSVAAAVTPVALARVQKTLTTYAPGTSGDFTDDLITYRLDLAVDNVSPDPTFTPSDLEGTLLQARVTGATAPTGGKFILISDNIPENTVLDVAALTSVTNWTPIYSNSAVASTTPLNATWNTSFASFTNGANDVTRIGWVYTGGVSLSRGTTDTSTDASGFQFRVQSTLTTAGQIQNIAQVFGETVGDLNNEIVYDESGDDRPNNFNDDNTPPDASGTDYNNDNLTSSDRERGIADSSTQGSDGNNDNTGTGVNGEVNIQPIDAPGILNGPDSQPSAVGPSDNNDDFQNLATLLECGSSQTPTRDTTPDSPADTINPDAVTFTNTFANSTNSLGELDTVTLLPLAPNDTRVPTESRQFAGDIPTGTTLTISTSDGSTAQYSYNGTAWNFVSGSGTFFDSGASALVFDNIQPGNTVDYTVAVNLPDTEFSEERFFDHGIDRAGYNFPIVAFVDNDGNGILDYDPAVPANQDDNLFNITIDRIYTGYVIILKEVRIIDTDGTTVLDPNTAADSNGEGTDLTPSSANNFGYITTPDADFNTLVVPGRILEYRVSYLNFSFTPTNSGSAAAGSAANNTTLDANSLVITEDGAVLPNNWSGLTTHRVGTTFTSGTTIEYFNGLSSLGAIDPSTGSTVSSYINTVGALTPVTDSAATAADQTDYQGALTFRRTIN